MATNDFVKFGTGVGANVDSEATFLTRSNSTGFASGSVAASAWVGKLLRQSSSMVYMIADLIVNQIGANVLDDGNTVTLEASFKAAIASIAQGAVAGVSSFNGRAGAVALSSGDVLTALGGTPIYVGGTAVGDLTGAWPGPTIKSGAVTNAKMANMPAMSVKANLTNAVAAPVDNALSAILTALGFDFSHIGASGYILGPNGFILQWGSGFVADDSVGTITMPIPFTSAVWGFQPGLIYTGSPKTGGNGGGATYNVIDLQHIRVMMAWNGDSTGIGAFTWWAWGI